MHGLAIGARTARAVVRPYLHVLRGADFRRLWIGATVSAVGDGMTFVALSWLVLAQPSGTTRLGLLGMCYTAPVLLGGALAGPLLDRFDVRVVLIADCLLRATAVALVPLAAGLGRLPSWLPFAVAVAYGLLKMVPLAGVPAAIPILVDDSGLDPANALESLSFSVAGVLGPAGGGLLIGWLGAAPVLWVDSASFLVFTLAVVRVRTPLRPQAALHGAELTGPPAAGALTVLGRDRVILATTVAFMMFNVAEGMLLVTAPWLARNRLPGGAAALGLLLSAMAVGELVGATAAGRCRTGRSTVRAIGIAQLGASAAFLTVLATPHSAAVASGFFTLGLLSAPMTVWAQSLRMRRIPPAMRGRAFATLRTLMQATPPAGAALVTPLLVHGQLTAAAVTMTAIAALPAVLLTTRSARLGRSADGQPRGGRRQAS